MTPCKQSITRSHQFGPMAIGRGLTRTLHCVASSSVLRWSSRGLGQLIWGEDLQGLEHAQG
eukprot:7211282-Alexandrium_andersonii.AAC.1